MRFHEQSAVSAIITNPLSGWVIAHFNWRYVFILEGLISVALLFIWMPLISDRPEQAKWISAEEKSIWSLPYKMKEKRMRRTKAQRRQSPTRIC